MGRLSKTILNQINNSIPEKDKFFVTENRGSHAMASAINFLGMIRENFSAEQADELTKRFINAIKTQDPRKFYRGLTHFKELHEGKNPTEPSTETMSAEIETPNE